MRRHNCQCDDIEGMSSPSSSREYDCVVALLDAPCRKVDRSIEIIKQQYKPTSNVDHGNGTTGFFQYKNNQQQ
jgi:hypothetical protein